MDEPARKGEGRQPGPPGVTRRSRALLPTLVLGGLCGAALALTVAWWLTDGFQRTAAPSAAAAAAAACQARLAAAETAAADAGRPLPTATARPARPTMTLRVAARSAPSPTPDAATPPPGSAGATPRSALTQAPTEVASITAALTRTPAPELTERATATLRILR